ncbi:MAG: amidohydrolase family protein [Gemmatimonadaceae bacterium]|nr:amidohydrolase family protein [Gemmatimonadaceae bacterium]
MRADFIVRRQAACALALVVGMLATTRAEAQAVAITNATIHPVSGPRIERGTIVIRNGVIAAVGTNVAIPDDAERVDGTGKIVTPGLVAVGTQLGLVEVGAVRETRDASARGTDDVAASFRAWDGFNAASVLLAPARQDGGVTTVGIVPDGHVISGQAAAIDLAIGAGADPIRLAPAFMAATLGDPLRAGATARGEELAKLRAVLTDARAFRTTRLRIETGQTRPLSASFADLQAMQPVLAGTIPLVIGADRASDILNAIRLGRDFGIRVAIAGGSEAWTVAPQLAAARVPVLAGALNDIPGSFSSLAQSQENLARLRAAGVTVAILGNGPGDEEAFNVRNLRYEAGNAVAYGLSWDDALRAITLAPAEVLGVAGTVGSLQVGKQANLVLWSGDPFEYDTRAERVFVRGVSSTAKTRQQLLTERYLSGAPRY